MLLEELGGKELTEEEFQLIRDFIYEKSGNFFRPNKAYYLKNRLLKRMVALNCKTFQDYYYRLKYDTTQREFNNLMNILTVNETSFFRNPHHLKAFESEILPELVARKSRKNEKTLSLWSAGCSSGEEPYTLALIMLETMTFANLWNIEIIANDISERVLYSARKGVYGKVTLRNTDRKYLDKYFTNSNGSYAIRSEIKRLVSFGYLNLTDFHRAKAIKNIDIIFCRNVLIYFGPEARKRIVDNFYDSLNPGGYLFIGHSESLHGVSKAFKLAYFNNAVVYKKE